jgi:glycogen synthase
VHVLITADTVGGVWIYVRELVTGLARRGVRVTLVSFGEIPHPGQTQWMDDLPGLDFRPTAFALEWMHDVQADMVASQSFLQSLIDEVKPDLLHFNQYYYGAIESDLPRIVVAHSDVISWWLAVHGHEPPATKWLDWYRKMIGRSLAHASRVVAPSRTALDSLLRNYSSPALTSVIYNGRTPHLFNPHITKEDCVVSVGRIWDSGKQVTLLCQQNPPIDAYIVGSDRHPDASLRAEASLGTAALPNLHFKGEQTEAQLRQLYGRAAMYAATSRYEPFGLAPVEAALSRCALVANDIPSFHELWGDAALYFDTNNARSLVTAIERLRSNPDLRQQLGNRAYQRALLRFTASRMVADYMALYEALVTAGALAA